MECSNGENRVEKSELLDVISFGGCRVGLQQYLIDIATRYGIMTKPNVSLPAFPCTPENSLETLVGVDASSNSLPGKEAEVRVHERSALSFLGQFGEEVCGRVI